MTMFEVPESVRPVRDRVEAFMRERVEPAEADLHRLADAAHHEPAARGELRERIRALQADAKAEGLDSLGLVSAA